MGEARARGTFEERKQKAIAAGRGKRKEVKIRRGRPENGFAGMPSEILAAMLLGRLGGTKKNRQEER